jgi:hypothetical protein
MEKAGRPLTTVLTHDNIVVRPKPDRRAQPRVPGVDIARPHPAKADLRTAERAKQAS